MDKNEDKLVSQLADRIRAKIESGELAPGARLRQEALAEEFSVSRTPIREALRQLEVNGLVLHVKNQGAIVRAPTAKEIREAYQVRAELEGLACELAVEWITEDQIAQMRSAQARFVSVVEKLTQADRAKSASPAARSKALPSWVESNEAFHRTILEASGNRKLRDAIDNLHIHFTRNVMLSASAMDGRRMRENVEQHEAILQALEQHDPKEARRTMAHHVLRSGEVAIRWLESQGDLR